MSALGTAALVVWALGSVVFYRSFVRMLIIDDEPDWTDVVFAVTFGAVFVWWWPIVMPARLLTRIARPEDALRLLVGESREQKLKRLERERRERDKRIRQMERELGIGE